MDICTDKNKFPNSDEPQLQVTYLSDDGLLCQEDRKLEIVPSNFTIEALEATVARHDDQIVLIETQKEKYVKLLEWAKKNGVIKTDEEYQLRKSIKNKKAYLAELKEKKDKRPEDVASEKAMIRELAKLEDQLKDLQSK